MLNLLSVELKKMLRLKSFYVLLLILITMGSIQSVTGQYPITNMETAVGSINDTSLVFILALIPLLYVGNDFSSRTVQNAVKAGYSRNQIVLSKMIIALPASAILHLCFVLSTCLSVGSVHGFSLAISFERLLFWWGVCLLQCCAVTSLNVMIGFLMRNSSLILIAGTCFNAVTCNFLRNFLSHRIFLISCFHFTDNYETGNLLITMSAAVFVIVLAVIASCLVFRKAEIK